MRRRRAGAVIDNVPCLRHIAAAVRRTLLICPLSHEKRSSRACPCGSGDHIRTDAGLIGAPGHKGMTPGISIAVRAVAADPTVPHVVFRVVVIPLNCPFQAALQITDLRLCNLHNIDSWISAVYMSILIRRTDRQPRTQPHAEQHHRKNRRPAGKFLFHRHLLLMKQTRKKRTAHDNTPFHYRTNFVQCCLNPCSSASPVPPDRSRRRSCRT